MSQAVHSQSDRESWIGIQRKTFSRWANSYLPPDAKINDLATDLASGVIVFKLLEKISEEKVGKCNTNPKMDIQKLENLNQCINFVKKHDIPLVNVGSSDILKGNEKIILGFLWSIILRFEVQGADGKQGLLLWLQRSTKGYPGVDVKDFTSSWKDGLAFNALIHRYRPDLLNFDELGPGDALGNCEKAFGIAESSLGISRLLDAEDVVESPDEKSQIAYLSQFFKKFAGEAKLEAKLRAIKNAVEVTRRHSEWIGQYEEGSASISSFCQSKQAELEQDSTSSTTEEVKASLDAFTNYMKQEKPAMSSKRAETEGLFTTLTSSKRNNNRPEYVPTVTVESFNQQWEALESAEQAAERKMLDKYLAFQVADHSVSKFNAKSTTINTWLDEKLQVFGTGDTGSSVPEIEAHLEMHTSYENRLALYESVMAELGQLVAKVDAAKNQGHAGAGQISSSMTELTTKMETVKSQGEAHKQKLTAALEQEKALVAKEKEYLHQIDSLDFQVDQLEERVNEDIVGATPAEMEAIQAISNNFDADVAKASDLVAQLSTLAQEINEKRPEASGHCVEQQQRLDAIRVKMSDRQGKVAEFLAAEQNKDELKKRFAQLANQFAEYCDAQRNKLGSLSGSLEDQKAALASLREETAGESSQGVTQLGALDQESQACDAANVVANPYTPHTIYSLRAQHEQLVKAMKRTDDSLNSQLMAQKALEIPAEQLKEIQEIFSVFDQDQDGKLRLSDLKEACLGAGIDLEDAELESRMKARSPNMMFSLDDFIAFFVEEVQTGDSKDDVIAAFKAISDDGTLSPDQIQSKFTPISKDVADYLSANLTDGDYASFTEGLFQI